MPTDPRRRPFLPKLSQTAPTSSWQSPTRYSSPMRWPCRPHLTQVRRGRSDDLANGHPVSAGTRTGVRLCLQGLCP